MKRLQDYSTYLPEDLKKIGLVRLGNEYWVDAQYIAEMQRNGGPQKPNTLLYDSSSNELYETWLDINNIGLDDYTIEHLRQFDYRGDLVYFLKKNRHGKYGVPEIRKVTKDTVHPLEFGSILSCPSAKPLFTIPDSLRDKINTTVLVIMGIVALFICWLMIQG